MQFHQETTAVNDALGDLVNAKGTLLVAPVTVQPTEESMDVDQGSLSITPSVTCLMSLMEQLHIAPPVVLLLIMFLKSLILSRMMSPMVRSMYCSLSSKVWENGFSNTVAAIEGTSNICTVNEYWCFFCEIFVP